MKPRSLAVMASMDLQMCQGGVSAEADSNGRATVVIHRVPSHEIPMSAPDRIAFNIIAITCFFTSCFQETLPTRATEAIRSRSSASRS